ncbi:MAG TPA: elongation factor G, partial [Candidatus Acidoferrales bacterium]
RPALLEPIMDVEITAPEQHMGDVMGDLNSRRGRVQGVDAQGHSETIKAQVPMAEMLEFATSLTSITQGRGSYHMEFSHYDFVPHELEQKIIAQHRPGKEAEVEEEA